VLGRLVSAAEDAWRKTTISDCCSGARLLVWSGLWPLQSSAASAFSSARLLVALICLATCDHQPPMALGTIRASPAASLVLVRSGPQPLWSMAASLLARLPLGLVPINKAPGRLAFSTSQRLAAGTWRSPAIVLARSSSWLLKPSASLSLAFDLHPVTLSPLVCFHVCLHAGKCVFASLLPTGIAIPRSSAL